MIITLLSDFGTSDGYVGAMKGVLLSRAPNAALVDLGHDVAAGDVVAASFSLRQAVPEFPAETVHLAVIDPGVGGPRRALAARIADQFVVAPDNGLLSGLLIDSRCEAACELDPEALKLGAISPVFHGRDLFAPAAAALARGAALSDLGAAVEPDALVRLPVAGVEIRGSRRVGVIQHVDRFGNLISNLRRQDLPGAELLLGERVISVHQSYRDVPDGALAALIGSHGYYEIACRGGSAAEVTGASRGDVVSLGPPARS